ncbi:MAG: RDD family protein, partial [Acidobacteriota bacterium]
MSLPNDLQSSEAEGQSSKGWRGELKRRIEAHQQRKEDSLNEAGSPSARSESQGQSPPAEIFSLELQATTQPKDAPRQSDSKKLHLPQSEEEALGAEGSLEVGPLGTESGNPDEDLSRSGFSTQEPVPVQPPFENGESGLPGTGPESIERSLDPAEFSGASRQQIVTFSDKATPSSPPLDKEFQLNVKDSLGLSASASDPFPGDDGAPDEDFPEGGSSAGGAAWISREIFLSRLLAGLVDLLLSSFVGLIFAWVASALLGFDFFSAASIEIALATGLLFYWVSSLFFLSLSGQTPGMHLTGLQLLYQESAELPFMAVFIRVLAIL